MSLADKALAAATEPSSEVSDPIERAAADPI